MARAEAKGAGKAKETEKHFLPLLPFLHPLLRYLRGSNLLLAVAALTISSLCARAQSSQPSQTDPTPAPSAPAGAKPSPASAQIKIGDVTFSGSLRSRLEMWDWFETDLANNSYNFVSVLLRLSLGQQKKRYEWRIESMVPWLINLPDDAIAPPPQGQLGMGANYFAANGRKDASIFIKQGFFRFIGLGGDKASSLKLGRFEFNEGLETIPTDPSLATIKRDRISQRLIGVFDFTYIGRSFDGLHFSRTSKNDNITFVGARPTEGVFQLRAWRELDVDFYYGAFTRDVKTKNGESDLRLFALYYHDGRDVLKTDNRPLALRLADHRNIRLTTIGGHHINVFKAGSGKADTLLWGVGQFGVWGNLTHRAGAIAAEAGYQFSGDLANKIKPWVRAGYFRGSGDGDPTDNIHSAFFELLPTPRLYARFPFYNLMNLEDSFVQLRLKPHAKVAMRTDLHHLRLSNSNDLWYQGGGAFQRSAFGYIGRPSNGEKTLATVADLSVDWNITPATALTFYVAGALGGGVTERIYPAGKNARFAYIEVTRRF